MFYTLACKEENLILDAGVPHCSGGWIVVQQPEQFNIEQLDPVVLGEMFGVGFGLVATVLLIGIGARSVLNFIKSA